VQTITFGKYKGETIAKLILKEPGYVKWMLEESDASGPMARVVAEVKRLIKVFDEKPLIVSCSGSRCQRRATRCSAYRGSPDLLQWCDECDMYDAGAVGGRLTEVRTYRDALKHIEFTDNGTTTGYRDIIKSLAKRKGLPDRVGAKQIADFFSDEPHAI
jgi:hypothetical protein